MADDTLEVVVPFQNRSSDPPASSTGYDFKALSKDQQRQLNELKIRTARDNYIYLKAHPEIPAIVTLLLKAVFTSKPRNIREFLAAYTKRPQLRLAVKTLVEKEQRPTTESSAGSQTSSSEAGRPPLSLANIVFPSSLKVEDYQEEAPEADKEATIIGEDIMSEILTIVEEQIKQKEDYQYVRNLLGSAVKDFKPTMYPPCEPSSYRHTLSEKERQSKEPTFVAEDIVDDLLTQVEENITLKEDTQYIKTLLNSLLPKSESKQNIEEE